MNMPSWIRVSSLAAAFVVLMFVPKIEAKGAKGGGHGGGHAKAPHMSAAKPHPAARSANRAAKAPKPHTAASHANNAKSTSTGNKQNHTAGKSGTTGTNRQNSHARNYAQRRNNSRRYGSSSGYRRNSSNQATRAVVSMLRSTHASLARIDHDYKGHRVQAMRSIKSAIRQLSHSSSRRYGSFGSGSGLSSFSGTGRNRNRSGTGTSGRGHMSQAASDSRMRQAYQKLQSANSRLANLGGTSSTGASSGSGSHTRARMHIQQAGRHLTTALSVR